MVDSLLEIITEREVRSFITLWVSTLTNAIDEIEVSVIFLAATFFVSR